MTFFLNIGQNHIGNLIINNKISYMILPEVLCEFCVISKPQNVCLGSETNNNYNNFLVLL